MIQNTTRSPWWLQPGDATMPLPSGTELDATRPPALPPNPQPLSRFDPPPEPTQPGMPDMPQGVAQQQIASALPYPPPTPAATPEPAPTPAATTPAPPPPPVAAPVAAPTAEPDPNAMGRDPVRRARMIGALEGKDALASTAPAEDPRITAEKDLAARLAVKSKEHVPAWRQALGAALTLSPRTQGISKMVLNPPDKAEELAGELRKDADQARLEEKARQDAQIHQMTAASLAEQRASLTETRQMTAEARQQNAENFKMRVAGMTSDRNRKFITERLKGREQDSSYQKETDQRVPNSEWISDPEKAGYGWMAPPAYSPLAPELAKYVPGSHVGEMISHTELQNARKVANQILMEQTKADNKSEPRTPLEDRIVSEYVAAHPGATLAQARAATQAKPPGEASSGTWALQEDAEGKPMLFNSKTGETKAAPQGLQKSGTVVKATAAKEKLEGPARDALGYASDYLANGAFTGAGDEALLEKFFELAKPSTGFRMSKPQMDMLQNSRGWMGSAAAHIRHATTGTWFDDEQRKQIVDTMKQLAAAKLKGGGPAAGGGTVRYSSAGRTYNIPAGEAADFLKDHPNAVKQ